jgi:hypothetical protein
MATEDGGCGGNTSAPVDGCLYVRTRGWRLGAAEQSELSSTKGELDTLVASDFLALPREG